MLRWPLCLCYKYMCTVQEWCGVIKYWNTTTLWIDWFNQNSFPWCRVPEYNYMFKGMRIWSEIHLSMQSNYYQSMRIKRHRVFCRKISQCSFLTNNDFDVPWMHLLCINSLDLLVLLTMNWHWACVCHTKCLA